MYGVLLLQLESTMEVIKADDKSVCVCRANDSIPFL